MRMRIYKYMRMFTCGSSVRTYMYISMCIYMCTYIHTYIHTCIHAYDMCTYLHILYVHTCIHTCMYTRIYRSALYMTCLFFFYIIIYVYIIDVDVRHTYIEDADMWMFTYMYE